MHHVSAREFFAVKFTRTTETRTNCAIMRHQTRDPSYHCNETFVAIRPRVFSFFFYPGLLMENAIGLIPVINRQSPRNILRIHLIPTAPARHLIAKCFSPMRQTKSVVFDVLTISTKESQAPYPLERVIHRGIGSRKKKQPRRNLTLGSYGVAWENTVIGSSDFGI